MLMVRLSLGIFLVFLALVVGGAALIAFVDPVGSQMANDHDPFGPSPNRTFPLAMLGASIALGIGGGYLIRRSSRQGHDEAGQG